MIRVSLWLFQLLVAKVCRLEGIEVNALTKYLDLPGTASGSKIYSFNKHWQF